MMDQGRGSLVGLYKTTEGQYSPLRSQDSQDSKLLILWHYFFEWWDACPLGEYS